MSESSFHLTDLLTAGSVTLPGAKYPLENLAGKVVAFYFSAHWCAPCRGFTPTLIQSYNSAKSAGLGFEVIFVSSDQEQEEFDEYWGGMPWPALKFEDEETREKVKAAMGCKGIPQLTVLEPQPGTEPAKLQFSLITHQGKNQVAKEKDAVIRDWCAEAAAQAKLAAGAASAPAPSVSPAASAPPAVESSFSLNEDF